MAAIRRAEELVEVGADGEVRLSTHVEPGRYRVVVFPAADDAVHEAGPAALEFEPVVRLDWSEEAEQRRARNREQFLARAGIGPEDIEASWNSRRKARGPLACVELDLSGWPQDSTFSRDQIYEDDEDG
jgi:hypothetical protein